MESQLARIGMTRADYQTYNTKGKGRKDWSGSQSQLWSSLQFPPLKVKFPYMIKTKISKINPTTGKFTHREFKIDDSGGKWYFEEELIFATPADKFNYNHYQDRYTGGLILMTKYQAREMGLSESDVLKNYRSDQAVKKNADKYGYEAPHYFFNYGKDGSIESIYTPPPPPVIKYIEVPVPAPPPPKVEVIPEPVFISEPEPVIAEQQVTVSEPDQVGLNPYQLKTNIDLKWMLLAFVIVGLLVAIIFTLRGRK